MKTIIFFSISILFLCKSFALSSKIEGKAPGAEELKIRFYIWDDFITYKEVLLAQADIDKKGNFSIHINMHQGEVLTGFFRILNFQSPEIYIAAGESYNLALDSFDYKDPNRIYIPHLSTIEIRYNILETDSSEVNKLISAFNIEYNTFLKEELNLQPGIRTQIMNRLPKSKIDSFEKAMNNKFKYSNNEFFQNYMNYTFAEMHLGFRSCGMKCIYDKYIYQKPVLYDNIQYMSFFSKFYQDFILSISTHITGSNIIKNVNYEPNLKDLLDTLGRDSLLRNELIREAVFLLNARDWYTSPYFNKTNLISLIQEYARSTKFDLQARIAKNLLFVFTRYNQGEMIPEFHFKNISGEIFNNDSLLKKTTYILFFNTWSNACISELKVMEKLYETWADSVHFVAVSMDMEPLKLYYFLDDHHYSFPVFHFGNDYLLAEKLSLNSIPHAMLLDEEGKYIIHTADLPSEGINDYFKKVYALPEEKKIDIGN